MCKACHGQNFEGGAPAPRLAGLDYTYLIGGMNGFANGTRTNNLDMPGFMRALPVSFQTTTGLMIIVGVCVLLVLTVVGVVAIKFLSK